MFLCISANPAIDKRLRVSELRLGAVNRVLDAIPEPGGKAAHVAMALRGLGARPAWVGFSGGTNGENLIAGLAQLGVRARSIATKPPTRVNLAIVDERGTVTEILEPGGAPSGKELNRFRRVCRSEFGRGGQKLTVLLSGSLPPGVPKRFCAELIRAARNAGCRAFLDSSGEALRFGLEARPDLVKPNREEAEFLTGDAIRNVASAWKAITKILRLGAKSAALSLGEDGLLWCPGKGEPVLHARAKVITGRSAVGSGDATLAGFAYASAEGRNAQQTLRWAAACGAANCLADSPGRIRLQDVRRIEKTVRVDVLPE